MKRRQFLSSIVPMLAVAPVVPLIASAPAEATGSGVTLTGDSLMLAGRKIIEVLPNGDVKITDLVRIHCGQDSTHCVTLHSKF
jgi:hypothetical protein